MPAVVLLSGGLDSAVNLKRALDETGIALALTLEYGQKAAAREIAAAAAMCQALGVRHRVVALPWLAEICHTALVNPECEVPRLRPEQLGEERVTSRDTARAVWVPNRNGVFIAIAAAFAESLGAEAVVTGFNAEEAATFPDNSAAFAAAATAGLQFSTATAVQVMSYTQALTKSEVVLLGRRIGAPLALVWSCYRGGEAPCGNCESCARFLRACQLAAQQS